MKTQISIQVKNENWMSRCMSIYMTLGLFVKAKVQMYIDSAESEAIKLKARKEPYVIDLAPGQHVIKFKAKSRKKADKLVGGAIMGAFGLGAGAYGGAMGAEIGADIASGLMGHTRVQDSSIACDLKEGDLLKIQIKPKRNGAVKIKVLSE